MYDCAFQQSNGSGVAKNYFTRDLMTDPPTVIQILSLPADAISSQRIPGKNGPQVFKVSLDDIEPTAGWLSDRNNSSLDICFMHSFGKCYGKLREKDPRTCHQLHIKREVLDSLRRHYVNPQRNYFCRTMKANVSEKFAQVLTLLARRRITLQYLEFRTDDIEVTAGSTEYEVEYRHWLLTGDDSQRKAVPKPANIQTDNFISTSSLCWDFALTGRCSKGASCPELHGHVAKALTKDRYVKSALTEMGKKDSWSATAVATVTGTPSNFSQNQVNPTTQMPVFQSTPSTPYVPPSPLPPYPFQWPQPAADQPSTAAFTAVNAIPLEFPSLNGAPCFFISDGNDNFFRLVTQAPYAPFNYETS